MSTLQPGQTEVSSELRLISSMCDNTAKSINSIFKNFHPHAIPSLQGDEVRVMKEGDKWSVSISDYPGTQISTYVIECKVDKFIGFTHQIGEDQPWLEINYSLNNGNSGLKGLKDLREGHFYKGEATDEAEVAILKEAYDHLATALYLMRNATISFSEK